MRSFASHLSAKLAQHRPSAVLSASVGIIQVMSERILAAAATRISTLRIAKQRSFKVSTKCRGFHCVMLFALKLLAHDNQLDAHLVEICFMVCSLCTTSHIARYFRFVGMTNHKWHGQRKMATPSSCAYGTLHCNYTILATFES